MFGCLARLLFVFAALVIVVPDLQAHDSWISRGGHRNAAGEWCCGEGDCFMVPAEQVKMGGDGYLIFGAEKIPLQRSTAVARRGLLALQTAGWNAALFLCSAAEYLTAANVPRKHA